jgi:hypothetical protein
MEISPENYHSHLLERVLDLLWSQWSALGTYTSSPGLHNRLVLPLLTEATGRGYGLALCQ